MNRRAEEKHFVRAEAFCQGCPGYLLRQWLPALLYLRQLRSMIPAPLTASFTDVRRGFDATELCMHLALLPDRSLLTTICIPFELSHGMGDLERTDFSGYGYRSQMLTRTIMDTRFLSRAQVLLNKYQVLSAYVSSTNHLTYTSR